MYALPDQEIDFRSLSSLLGVDDQNLQNLISELILEAEEMVGDKQRMHQDCIKRIQDRHYKLLVDQLSSELREAEANNDTARVQELLMQKNHLKNQLLGK